MPRSTTFTIRLLGSPSDQYRAKLRVPSWVRKSGFSEFGDGLDVFPDKCCKPRLPCVGLPDKVRAAACGALTQGKLWRQTLKKARLLQDGPSDADLQLSLRDALTRLAKPTSVAELRKALPKPYQRPPAELKRVLDTLVEDKTVFAFQEGKTFKYSVRDPDETLVQATMDALANGPLTKKDLVLRLKQAVPGFDKRLPAVLADLVVRGKVCEHPKASAKEQARYGLEPPDLTPFLAKAVKEVQAVQKKLASQGVSLSSIIAALGRTLGIATATPTTQVTTPQGAADDESAVLNALRELASREPSGSLLSIGALRALCSLPKTHFDTLVLRLSRAGRVVLHHHDFPTSLSEEKRAELVQDERGTSYVGIALGKKA